MRVAADLTLAVVPRSIGLGEATISVEVTRNDAQAEWRVRVIITRRDDQPRLQGDAVETRLLRADGTLLRQIAGATGLLPQAGGSLGMSANADFRFAAEGNDLPTALDVAFQGQTVHFTLQPKAPA
jgi:hypothetical protein